jgi:hypothetical protein
MPARLWKVNLEQTAWLARPAAETIDLSGEPAETVKVQIGRFMFRSNSNRGLAPRG